MPTLATRLKADAEEQLRFPPGTLPGDELPRFKRFLKVQTDRLRILHRGGAGGREICQARALVLDLLLGAMWDMVAAHVPPAGSRSDGRFALIAVGGYGRAELNPCSDIDIIFLHSGDSLMTTRGKPAPFLAAITGPKGLLYTLFDLGLKVGHSTRNIEDCVRAANSDMLSKTAFMEARRVAGDESLFRKMLDVVIAKCVRGHEDAYIKARLVDQESRRARYGNSACLQEPNLKNGAGGLRDYQNLLWMALFKYRIGDTRGLIDMKVLDPSEARQLEAAYDFILRVRTELHYHQKRAVDSLLKAVQPAIALSLGYEDRSPARRIEVFMRVLYLHMRNIHLITRTVEHRLASLPSPERRLPSLRQLITAGRQRVRRQLLDGFLLVDGEIRPATRTVFKEDPSRMMRAFLYAQQRGLRIHPDLAHLLNRNLSLVDRKFLHDPRVSHTFIEILSQRGNVAAPLRAMHEVGFLGKYIPEFGKLTVLVQHEFFHTYTADEHTLVCLEKADRLWDGAEARFKAYSDIFRQVERPFILYLALLLHDAGKADHTGDHSHRGGELAIRVARRLGLDGSVTHALRLLVDNHLLLAKVSQKYDLDERSVVRRFADQIQSVENLLLLALLTVADSLGTSDKLWNGFKDSLLWSLVGKARQLLDGGTAFLINEVRQTEILIGQVRDARPAWLTDEEIQAHFSGLPSRYHLIHTAQDILRDLALVHKFLQRQVSPEDVALLPVLDWTVDSDRGFALVKVCTWDRLGLFSKITGCFAASGLTILGAQIFSRLDRVIIDTFQVQSAKSGIPPTGSELERFEALLGKCLTGSVDLEAAIARQTQARPLYPTIPGQALPIVIRFDNDASETATVIEIECEDRIGLLHAISETLGQCQLDIAVAKISTEKGAAFDTFYVHEVSGGKVVSLQRQDAVKARLETAISRLKPG